MVRKGETREGRGPRERDPESKEGKRQRGPRSELRKQVPKGQGYTGNEEGKGSPWAGKLRVGDRLGQRGARGLRGLEVLVC